MSIDDQLLQMDQGLRQSRQAKSIIAEQGPVIHTIECWNYDSTVSVFEKPKESKKIGENDIESWLLAPSPSIKDHKPVAGLRVICIQPPVSSTLLSCAPVLEKVDKILDVPKPPVFLDTRRVGVCGHYLEHSNNPSKLYGLHVQYLKN